MPLRQLRPPRVGHLLRPIRYMFRSSAVNPYLPGSRLSLRLISTVRGTNVKTKKLMMEGSGPSALTVDIIIMFTPVASVAGDAPLRRKRATSVALQVTIPTTALMELRWVVLGTAAVPLAEVARIPEVQAGLLPLPGHQAGKGVVDRRWRLLLLRRLVRTITR